MNSERKEVNELQSQITSELTKAKKNDSLINEKIRSIQAKIKTITCPYPDDYLLQMFVEDLNSRVSDRLAKLESLKTRARNSERFDA